MNLLWNVKLLLQMFKYLSTIYKWPIKLNQLILHVKNEGKRTGTGKQGTGLFCLRPRKSRYFKDSLILLWPDKENNKNIDEWNYLMIWRKNMLGENINIIESYVFYVWTSEIDSKNDFACIHFSKLYLMNYFKCI